MSIDAGSASAVASGGRVFGFFTVLLILTLNANNGSDLLDVVVPYIQAQTEALASE
jgi:hypothetical protein